MAAERSLIWVLKKTRFCNFFFLTSFIFFKCFISSYYWSNGWQKEEMSFWAFKPRNLFPKHPHYLFQLVFLNTHIICFSLCSIIQCQFWFGILYEALVTRVDAKSDLWQTCDEALVELKCNSGQERDINSKNERNGRNKLNNLI